MAWVRDHRVVTVLLSDARKATNWRFRTARNRRRDSCAATVTTQVLETSLQTGIASSSMAEHRAVVGTALKQSPARPGADMLRFEPIIILGVRSSGVESFFLL